MLNKLRELREKNEGFTIIEVVIVLAIAGLIFAIVFVAVPQLQASQRDTQRRSDVGRLAAAVSTYASNNNGSVPADAAAVSADVVGTVIQDFNYDVVGNATPSNTADPEEMGYLRGTDCDGTSVSSREFSIYVDLENGDVYCAEN